MKTEADKEGFRVERKINPDTRAVKFLFYLKDKLVPHVPIAGKVVQRLNGFGMIHKDLATVLGWLKDVEKLLDTLESPPGAKVTRVTDREFGNKIKCLFVSSLVFYAKAFTKAGGRNAQLSKDMLDASFHGTHDEVMKYRHNVAAHSGLEKLEYGESCVLLLPADDDSFTLTIHTNRSQPDFAIESGGVEQFKSLVEHAMTKADAHYQKIATKLGQAAHKQGAKFWMTAYGRSKTIDMDDLPKK